MTKQALPKVGIVGGAGPMAGLLLCQKIIQLCQQQYGCQQDADFPYLMLLSYPFADMLKSKNAMAQQRLIQAQLKECLDTFASQGIQLGAIACNTLHAFLDAKQALKIVHIVEQITQVLKQKQIYTSLVLCSGSSVKSQLHQSYFNCCYPTHNWQIEVDDLIDRILSGQETVQDAKRLICVIQASCFDLLNAEVERIGIVLGCTEFSVLNEKWPLSNYGLDHRFTVIDSTQVLAERICQSIFDESNKNIIQ